MSDIYFINGPITKYTRQQCECSDSHCENVTEFGEAKFIGEDGRFEVPIVNYLDVC